MPDIRQNKAVVYDLYQLRDSDEPVFLSITIGYAQDGNSAVKLDGESLAEDKVNSFRMEIGKNNELHGKELKITSLITDVQEEIDKVSITILVSGGVEAASWVMIKDSEDHQTYPFRATIGLSK